LVIFLAGCAFQQPMPMGEAVYDIPVSEAAQLVERLAKKCWRKEFKVFGGDGISVDARKSFQDTYVLTARRYAPDIGEQPVFFRIELKDSPVSMTLALFTEGSFACGLNGKCHTLNFTGQSKAWLSGDHQCAEKE